jgi:hypothetical protein
MNSNIFENIDEPIDVQEGLKELEICNKLESGRMIIE